MLASNNLIVRYLSVSPSCWHEDTHHHVSLYTASSCEHSIPRLPMSATEPEAGACTLSAFQQGMLWHCACIPGSLQRVVRRRDPGPAPHSTIQRWWGRLSTLYRKPWVGIAGEAYASDQRSCTLRCDETCSCTEGLCSKLTILGCPPSCLTYTRGENTEQGLPPHAWAVESLTSPSRGADLSRLPTESVSMHHGQPYHPCRWPCAAMNLSQHPLPVNISTADYLF